MKGMRQAVSWIFSIGATFVFCEVVNINNFVGRLTAHSWNLKSYLGIFWVVFGFITMLFVAFLSSWKRKPSYPESFLLVCLGIVIGHATAILSYLIAALVGSSGLERLVGSLESTGVPEFILFLLIMPTVLLGWLNGGIFISLYLLIGKLARNIGGDSLMAADL